MVWLQIIYATEKVAIEKIITIMVTGFNESIAATNEEAEMTNGTTFESPISEGSTSESKFNGVSSSVPFYLMLEPFDP